jgi:hypothetical protein
MSPVEISHLAPSGALTVALPYSLAVAFCVNRTNMFTLPMCSLWRGQAFSEMFKQIRRCAKPILRPRAERLARRTGINRQG